MITTRIIRTSALLAILAPCVVDAQSVDTAIKQRSTHIRVAGGTLWGDGPVGLVGIDWQPVHSRFGIRATADFSQRSSHFMNFSPTTLTQVNAVDCTSFCLDRTKRSLGGVSVDAKYDLLTGRFRPYVFSGFGLYRSVDTQFSNADCHADQFNCTLTPGELHSFSNASFVGSLHSGLGASLRLKGRLEIFGEMTWRALDTQSFMSRDWHGPTIFGFRF